MWEPEWSEWVPPETVEALRESYMPEMPPVEGGGYLLGYLWEIGPTIAAGMGAGPITHQELRAWQDNTGVVLQPWEARFLRRLSLEYLSAAHKAEKGHCPAPWQLPDAKLVVTAQQAALRALVDL